MFYSRESKLKTLNRNSYLNNEQIICLKNYFTIKMNDYTTVIGSIWKPINEETGEYIFPEQEMYDVNPNGVSLAFSGGGGRSYSACIGYVRALLDIDLPCGKNAFSKAQYLSSVSGGSWFIGTYLFGGKSSKLMLGESIEIDKITTETLVSTNYKIPDHLNDFMGVRITNALVVPIMSRGYSSGVLPEYLWNYAIGKIFLDHYNIFGKIFVQDNEYASKVSGVNKNIKFITPRENCGFWICNTTVENKDTMQGGYVQCQITPLYSGISESIGSYPETVGGVFIDTFAFGAKNPFRLNSGGFNGYQRMKKVMNIPNSQGGLFTLENAIGTSSAAYGYVSYVLSIIGDKLGAEYLSKVDEFNPVFNLWSPNEYRTIPTQLVDGYVCDNTGILSLVQRGSKHIIAFNNNTSIEDSFCSLGLMQLFGVNKNQGCTVIPNTDTIQIFRSEDWALVESQINETKSKGGATYCHLTLDVIKNKQNAVEGGYKVELLIIILNPSTIYNNKLPTEISSTFSDASGPYPFFPNYPTMLINGVETIEMTPEQVNLLSSYTEWSISNTELKDIIKNMYSKGL